MFSFSNFLYLPVACQNSTEVQLLPIMLASYFKMIPIAYRTDKTELWAPDFFSAVSSQERMNRWVGAKVWWFFPTGKRYYIRLSTASMKRILSGTINYLMSHKLQRVNAWYHISHLKWLTVVWDILKTHLIMEHELLITLLRAHHLDVIKTGWYSSSLLLPIENPPSKWTLKHLYQLFYWLASF